MYNTTRDRAPTKPINISKAQADHNFAIWLRENNIKTVTDALGISWQINADIQLLPDAVNRSGEHWQIQIILQTECNGKQLLDSKAFNPNDANDSRLIGLLANRSIQLKTTGPTIVTTNLSQAKTQLAAALVILRQEMSTKDFRELKRQAVASTIDQSGKFVLKP